MSLAMHGTSGMSSRAMPTRENLVEQAEMLVFLAKQKADPAWSAPFEASLAKLQAMSDEEFAGLSENPA